LQEAHRFHFDAMWTAAPVTIWPIRKLLTIFWAILHLHLWYKLIWVKGLVSSCIFFLLIVTYL
jgi:hypothetical protein